MGKIFPNDMTDKGLISKIYEQITELNTKKRKKQTAQSKNGRTQFLNKYTQMANRHTKRYSTPLIIREMQIKTTMRYYLILVRMAIIKMTTNNQCWGGCRKKGTFVPC